jgi:hypothetical protein
VSNYAYLTEFNLQHSDYRVAKKRHLKLTVCETFLFVSLTRARPSEPYGMPR